MSKNIIDKWMMIVKINKEIDDLYHNLANYFHLSDSAFWILYSLYEHKEQGGLTQKEICLDWAYSKQTIHSAIKKLLTLQYITIENASTYHQGKKIYLTSLGIEVAKQTVEKVMCAEEQSFSKVKEEDLDHVIRIFQQAHLLFKEEAKKIYASKKERSL